MNDLSNSRVQRKRNHAAGRAPAALVLDRYLMILKEVLVYNDRLNLAAPTRLPWTSELRLGPSGREADDRLAI